MRRDKSTWRLFERFVSDLERHCRPDPRYTVTMSDFIDDIDGCTREIDCTVRFRVGDKEELTIIECRDRTHGNGIDWVEQIKTKRDDLNAAQAILVHRRPLTKCALKKARRLGIDVRQLRDVPTRISPIHIARISFDDDPKWQVRDITIKFPEDSTGNEPLIEFIKSRCDAITEACQELQIQGTTLPRVRLTDAVMEVMGIPDYEGPESEHKFVHFKSTPEQELSLVLNEVEHVVEFVEVRILTVRPRIDVDHKRTAEYSDVFANVAEVVDQYTSDSLGRPFSGVGSISSTDGAVQYEITFPDGIGPQHFHEAAGEIAKRVYADEGIV
jgi:hypothetical protein